MGFLHKWQGKISKIVIDEDSPSNTPNDNHQLKIVSLQKQSSLLKHLMYFFLITQEVARNLSCYHRHPLLKRLSLR